MVFFMLDGEAVCVSHTAKTLDPACAALQRGNPRRLRLLGAIPGDHVLATEIKQALVDDRIQGIWYEYTPFTEKMLDKYLSIA